MAPPEVRLDRRQPAEIDSALERAPEAWIPLGAPEYHARHLPNGTDGVTGHGGVVAAAERLGGVVLPWSYLTIGTWRCPGRSAMGFGARAVDLVLRLAGVTDATYAETVDFR